MASFILFFTPIGLKGQPWGVGNGKQENGKPDLAWLWENEIRSLSGLKTLHVDSSPLHTLDLSGILAFQDSGKHETPGFFSSFIGALGPHYQRTDWLIRSAYRVQGQDYNVQMLVKQGKVIDTLQGSFKLKHAFECDLLNDSDNNIMVFIYRFTAASAHPGRDIAIQGTFSLSFILHNRQAENYWMADGEMREFVRTFVGQYTDKAQPKPQQLVFAIKPAGLYAYLPFCDDLYHFNKKDYCPDYYRIKKKYRKYGWGNYRYDAPKAQWWR